jgi:hypothetical protein
MKTDINLAAILAERLRRQRLTEPLKDPEKYVEFFGLLQPVSPVGSSRPGDPPRLVHRTVFDDGALAGQMREERIIVKGRFLGGTIGYVLAEDLELYANAFCRPLSGLNETQQTVLDAIIRSETLTPRQIKEETGLLNKQIMPALHRLQKAFLVYEDQVDSDWERNWYEFSAEWPEINLEEEQWDSAAAQVLLRFLRCHVFATSEQLKDWSRWPSKPLARLVRDMEENGALSPQVVQGLGEGWICAQDTSLKLYKSPPSVFMLHASDILTRSHASELKRRFGDQEVLQYLLIDGAFQGAVLGHWRIGPHDVEDIIVELSAAERMNRREEILKAVAWQYRPPHSRILKYAGEEVNLSIP